MTQRHVSAAAPPRDRAPARRGAGLATLAALLPLATTACHSAPEPAPRIRLVVDTDANNELDDQHALAYAVLGDGTFDVEGVTVNATRAGGDVHQHAAEAHRVLQLCGRDDRVPVHEGANAGFAAIRPQLDAAALATATFDGADAVRFLVARARARDDRRLVVLPIGKLTNVALALAAAPDIAARIRVVWLGSNYPEPGEYNLENDPAALDYVLQTDVPFEIVTVRYGRPTGTDAVRVTRAQIRAAMAGRGPRASPPVPGRHGGAFTCFGDYAVSLFEAADLYGDPPARALFDVAAVAVVKNAAWATARTVPAPRLVDGAFVERPDNPRRVTVWERFDRDAIVADFFATFADVAAR